MSGGLIEMQRRMQLRAMQRNVGRAEALLDLGAHRVQIGDLARVPLAIVSDLRREPDTSDALLEPEAAHHFHRVGIQLQAGADPGERLRLLVDVDLEPDPSQALRPRVRPAMPAPMIAMAGVAPPSRRAGGSVHLDARRLGDLAVEHELVLDQLGEAGPVERHGIEAQS